MKGTELGIAAWNYWGKNGVKVFPCGIDKRPLCRWKSEASDQKDEILKLFARAADKATAIGAAMGEHCGLFVLDFDTHKDGSAREFQNILKASSCLPDTRVHRTQNGGEHWFYFVPDGFEVPRNGVPHNGVDIRGEGGYVLVPPTRGYEVVSSETAEAPEELVERINQARKAFNTSTVAQLRRKIIEGDNFHEAATLIAAKLNGAGKDPAQIMEFITNALEGSVAKNPRHPRHSRWLALAEDRSGELGRILGSAYSKFNPQKSDDTFVGLQDTPNRNPKVTAAMHSLFGAPPPDDPVTPDVSAPDGDFPFARSYTAAEVDEQDDKAFLVYPLIMESDVIVLSAKPKEGKTLTAMNLALHMAAGIEVEEDFKPIDRKGNLSKIPVVYFALEGQGAIRKRIRGWLDHQLTVHKRRFKRDDLLLYVVEEGINLADDEAKQKIVDKLTLANAYFKQEYEKELGFVVFDTLTKTMPGKDQNSVEDTSSVFQTIDMMRRSKINASVMFVHHNDKAGKGPRGSSNILAEPDTILTVEKLKPIIVDDIEKDAYSMSVMMARSVDDSLKYKFVAHSMEIGKNSQGIMETAPVLEAIEDFDAAPTADENKLKKAAKKAVTEFYSHVYVTMSGAPDMQLGVTRLHRRLINGLSDSAKAFYTQHINDNSKEGVVSALKVLLSDQQLPADLMGVSFHFSEEMVSMTAGGIGPVTSELRD